MTVQWSTQHQLGISKQDTHWTVQVFLGTGHVPCSVVRDPLDPGILSKSIRIAYKKV